MEIKFVFYQDIFWFFACVFGLTTSSMLVFHGLKKGNSKAYFGIFLFGYSWFYLIYLLISAGAIVHAPILIKLLSPLYYALPPALYLFIRNEIFDYKLRLQKKDLIHFIPVVLAAIDMIPFFLLSEAQRLEMAQSIAHNMNAVFDIEAGFLATRAHYFLRNTQELIYGGISIYLFVKHRKELFTAIYNAIIIAVSFLALRNVIGVVLIYQHINGEQIAGNTKFLFIAVLLISAMIWLSYYALNWVFEMKFQNFRHSRSEDTEEENEALPSNVLNRLVLGDIEIQKMASAIEEKLLNDKNWIAKNWRLEGLADELGVPKYKLSYFFNSHLHKSFKDWLNQERLKLYLEYAAKGELKKYTLISLAEKCGFRSKSVFYSVFKKSTGQTPNEYFAINQ